MLCITVDYNDYNLLQVYSMSTPTPTTAPLRYIQDIRLNETCIFSITLGLQWLCYIYIYILYAAHARTLHARRLLTVTCLKCNNDNAETVKRMARKGIRCRCRLENSPPQKIAGGRFFHRRRSWINRPSAIYSRSPSLRKSPPGDFFTTPSVRILPPIVWLWEICPYDSDFFNRGDFFTWWLNRFSHEKLAPLWSR